MAINIFEGARRIAKIVAAGGTVITIVVIASQLKDGQPIASIVGGLVISLAIFWVFVRTTGWIVRGFAGISNGHDHRAI